MSVHRNDPPDSGFGDGDHLNPAGFPKLLAGLPPDLGLHGALRGRRSLYDHAPDPFERLLILFARKDKVTGWHRIDGREARLIADGLSLIARLPCSLPCFHGTSIIGITARRGATNISLHGHSWYMVKA